MDTQEALRLIQNALCEVAPDKAQRFYHIAPETQICDLGIDSVGVLEMIGSIEDQLARTLEADTLSAHSTLADIVALIQAGANLNRAR